MRRQTEKTEDWCRRNGVQLDQSMSLRDEGVSAYKGKHRENPDTHALASFVNAVKSGRVQPGSYLVVESLDRLSREKIRPALTLLLNLIEAGVKVVQLIPVEAVYDEDVEPMQLMMAVMELNRGHSESKVKSVRVGDAWAKKRKNAASKVVTRKLPGWVECDSDGKLVLISERAEVVRRIFRLAREGLGVHRIAVTLNADRVPVMGRTTFKGRAVQWNETVVHSVLKSRATFGEFQPHKGRGSDRQPVGEPVANYFPPVITRAEFDAVRGILSTRKKVGGGRRGRHVNLFAGLLKDARTGGSLTAQHTGNRSPTLIPVGAKQGSGDPWVSFLLKPFEDSLRAELAEVKVKDIADDGGAAERVEVLSGRLAEVESLAAKWRPKMDDPNLVEVVAAKLTELEAKRKALASELAEAQAEAAHPVSEAWGAARVAGKALGQDDTSEARERYRTAVRRVVEAVFVLIMPGQGKQGRAPVRVAAAQVLFKTGAVRSYLIGYRPGRGSNGTVTLKPRSFAASGVGDGLDLRKPDHVKRLERQLAEADLRK